MIRFGVVLSVVLIAIGLLVTGVVAGSLLLVVISIGVALLALLVLIGVVISFRHEIFGRTPIGVTAAGTSLAAPAGQGATQGRPVRPEPVTAAALTGLETASRPARVSLAEPAERATSDRPGPPPAEVRDRSRAKQEPGQPGAAPAGPVSPPDVRQKGAAARSKAQAAPLPQAPKPAEPAAARTRADPDESSQREPAAAAEKARPDSTTAGPAGSRSATAANREGADRGRLATQHGAGRLDRPSAEQPGDRDHAEPHRASRLERESVRAAGARSAAAETAIPAGAPAVAARDSAAASAGAAAKPAEPTASAAASGRTPGKPDPAEAPPLPTAKPARSDEQRDQEEAGSERTRQAEAAEAPAPVAAVASEPAIASTADDTPAGESAAGDDAMQVSVVPGITRYHRSDCQLIRFLSADDLDMMTKQAATENGCVPCKACKPDQLAADPAAG